MASSSARCGSVLLGVLGLVTCVSETPPPRVLAVSRDGVVRTADSNEIPSAHMLAVRWLDSGQLDHPDPDAACAELATSGFVAIASSSPFPRRWRTALSRSGLSVLEIEEIPPIARTLDVVTPWNESELDAILASEAGAIPWIEASVLPLAKFDQLEKSLGSPEGGALRSAFHDRATVELAARRHRAAAWRSLVGFAVRESRGMLLVAGEIDSVDPTGAAGLTPTVSGSIVSAKSEPAVRFLGSDVERSALRSVGIRFVEDAEVAEPAVTLCGDLEPARRGRVEFERIVRSLHRVANDGGVITFLEPPDREHPLVRYGLLPEFELVAFTHAFHAAVPAAADLLGTPGSSSTIFPPAFAECLPRMAFVLGPSSVELVLSIDIRGVGLGSPLFQASYGQGAVIGSTFRLLDTIDRHVEPRLLLQRIVRLSRSRIPKLEKGSMASLSQDSAAWNVEDVLERFDRERALRRDR